MDRTLIWQLASRYMRGKRSANAVPILSRISMVAIAVCSAAMIIIFSAFNGLETLAKDTYKAFYPDLRISVIKGKFFDADSSKLNAIKELNGVQHISMVIEDNVLANDIDNTQMKALTLKGIDAKYFDVNDTKQYIVKGADSVSLKHHTAIAGFKIYNELGLDVNFIDSKIVLYYLNPTVTNPEADPTSAYQELQLHPDGVFKVEDEFDDKYVLAPLPLVQELFHEPGKYSSIEISTAPGYAEKIKLHLQQLFGNAYKVETRYEQNRTMYSVMAGEKWGVYAILLLVLLIASFNMVGALSMMVIEKQKDIAILKAMGANPAAIRKIFLLEGVLWSLTGGVAGILFGLMICLSQEKFNIIKLQGSFLVSTYPVQINPSDILLVICTILVVGVLASWYPATRSTRTVDPSLKGA